MTHAGDLPYMPATGRKIFVRTIADCLVENGRITKEWLVRDNYSLALQIGAAPLQIARHVAGGRTPECRDWLEAEYRRAARDATSGVVTDFSPNTAAEYSAAVLRDQWVTSDSHERSAYAPYAVLYDSQVVSSGAEAIKSHYTQLRHSMAKAAVSVDYVTVQDRAAGEYRVAVRWTLAFEHVGPLWGLAPTGKPAVLLGVTHWQINAGRIVAEWSVYDRIALLAQLV